MPNASISTKIKFSGILLITFLEIGAIGGCYHIQIPQAISRYQAAESKVKLGDNREDVLAILMPTQANLSADLKRAPEVWIDSRSGKSTRLWSLYYFRSGWSQDGRLTDDELTPYLFVNDSLVAIGWNALRSLAFQSQAMPQSLASGSQANTPESQGGMESGLFRSPEGQIYLGPIAPNAYGPGINSDATGRPFTYQPDFGGSGYPDPTLKVKPNAYGPGVGMDQYGRPVRPRD
ncbi:hypothetical protein PJI16_11510 [Nitrospira sp. MA-1]|nr:hypothetical protein [Nitrospira sp. MA-1]